MPARSRHCNGEQTQVDATKMKVLGRFGRAMIQSQENCLSNNLRFNLRATGRGLCTDTYYSILAILAGNFIGVCMPLEIMSLPKFGEAFSLQPFRQLISY